MADENEKDSPSADEIVDDMAADMGVEDETVPEESGDGAMDGLGGIFDVPSSSKRKKKKKKKKKAAEPKEDAPKEAASDEGEEAGSKKDSEASKKSAKEDLEELAGVLTPSTSGGGGDGGGDYLDEGDLDEFKGGGPNTSTIVLGLVIVVLLGALGFVAVNYTDAGGDVAALFQGELREQRLAEAERRKEEWEAEQEAKLEKYGTLNITGAPKYAVIKLDGEVQYGQTSSGAWRELRLGQSTVFQNVKVKKEHSIEVSAPGFDSESYKLTEGRWDEGAGGPYSYVKMLTVNLVPQKAQNDLEYQQRMDTTNTDDEYYGEVTIKSNPAGAKVVFNTHPLLDKNGDELTTPVTFDKYYVKDEDSGKLEEKEVNVDTPPDRGHKIQLMVPEEKGEYPEYVTALQRRMWTCEWKDGQPPAAPPSGKTFRDLCNYKFTLDMDFKGLNDYIERREEEKRRVQERNEQLKAQNEAAAEEEAEE